MLKGVFEMNLTPEQELIIIASRVDINPPLKERFKTLLRQRLDWGKIIYQAVTHKVFTLLWFHIRSSGLSDSLEPEVKNLFRTSYRFHQERNRSYLSEFGRILEVATRRNIRIVAIKGALFLGRIYPDLGMRTISDIDVLIAEEDVKKITHLLFELGYTQGKYDPFSEKVKPLSRKEKLFWTLYVSNLYPFRRKAEASFITTYNLDVHVSITWKGAEQYFVDTKELLNRSHLKTTYELSLFSLPFYDNLIHLCCHLYRHAVLLDTIRGLDDLALIRFCDIREYIRKESQHIKWGRIAQKVKEYAIERPVYYALYYLRFLYNDTVPLEFLEVIRPKDVAYLNQYGMLDSRKKFEWKMPFIERVFNTKRLDEFAT